MKLNSSIFLLLVLIITSLLSCNQDKDTKLFEKYLKSSFNRDLPQKATYIVLNDRACGGCTDFVFNLAKNKKNDYLYILPRPYRNKFQSSDTHVMIDTTTNISKLKFHKGNVGKIRVVNGKVISTRAYEPFEMQSIIEE